MFALQANSVQEEFVRLRVAAVRPGVILSVWTSPRIPRIAEAAPRHARQARFARGVHVGCLAGPALPSVGRPAWTRLGIRPTVARAARRALLDRYARRAPVLSAAPVASQNAERLAPTSRLMPHIAAL